MDNFANKTVHPHLLEFSYRRNGGATVAARIDFLSFNKAMEFNELIIGFLTKELAVPSGDNGE